MQCIGYTLYPSPRNLQFFTDSIGFSFFHGHPVYVSGGMKHGTEPVSLQLPFLHLSRQQLHILSRASNFQFPPVSLRVFHSTTTLILHNTDKPDSSLSGHQEPKKIAGSQVATPGNSARMTIASTCSSTNGRIPR